MLPAGVGRNLLKINNMDYNASKADIAEVTARLTRMEGVLKDVLAIVAINSRKTLPATLDAVRARVTGEVVSSAPNLIAQREVVSVALKAFNTLVSMTNKQRQAYRFPAVLKMNIRQDYVPQIVPLSLVVNQCVQRKVFRNSPDRTALAVRTLHSIPELYICDVRDVAPKHPNPLKVAMPKHIAVAYGICDVHGRRLELDLTDYTADPKFPETCLLPLKGVHEAARALKTTAVVSRDVEPVSGLTSYENELFGHIQNAYPDACPNGVGRYLRYYLPADCAIKTIIQALIAREIFDVEQGDEVHKGFRAGFRCTAPLLEFVRLVPTTGRELPDHLDDGTIDTGEDTSDEADLDTDGEEYTSASIDPSPIDWGDAETQDADTAPERHAAPVSDRVWGFVPENAAEAPESAPEQVPGGWQFTAWECIDHINAADGAGAELNAEALVNYLVFWLGRDEARGVLTATNRFDEDVDLTIDRLRVGTPELRKAHAAKYGALTTSDEKVPKYLANVSLAERGKRAIAKAEADERKAEREAERLVAANTSDEEQLGPEEAIDLFIAGSLTAAATAKQLAAVSKVTGEAPRDMVDACVDEGRLSQDTAEELYEAIATQKKPSIW